MNGNISFSSLLFCFRSLDSLLWILFLIVGFLSKFVGSLRPSSVFFSSKVVSEEFFRRILKASSFTNPFLTLGGWHEVKCVCKKVSICLKCVFASRIDFSLNLVPLYTTASKNIVSVSNVSVVNLIVGWCKFACSVKASMSVMSDRENIVYVAFPNCWFKDVFA